METLFKICFILCLIFLNINAAVLSKAQPKPKKQFGDQQPQQINIAIGDSQDEIVVTWFTAKETSISKVNYGKDFSLSFETTGVSHRHIDGGFTHRRMWFHRVRLTNLLEDTLYGKTCPKGCGCQPGGTVSALVGVHGRSQITNHYSDNSNVYRCGSSNGWSDVFYFKTMKSGTDWPVSVAMYGDMGIINPQALSSLQMEAQNLNYNAMIHVGDFAYDMHTYSSKFADAFMNRIEPVAAYVPYMVCPGNHEETYNFSNYKTRFTMPMYDMSENMFYSWNMGPVHFIAINTEAYYFFEYGEMPLVNMFNWLIADLEEATKPEVRKERPWIILYGHRPMYCSNADGDDCTKTTCAVRVGFTDDQTYGLEKVLAKYGVDLAVWAHEHSYERLWPLYDYQVLNGTGTNPYENPRGPVHLITGSAGCIERRTPFTPDKPYWSAARSNDYGYTRVTIHNSTHLHWDQISVDRPKGTIVDQVWLVREKHEPYTNLL